MKTALLVTVFASVVSLSAHAQWTTSGSNIYYTSGNVGIGTTGPGEKLSVSGGNINISNQNYLKTGQMYFQYTNVVSNNYVRGIVGQNIIWDPSTSQWYIPNTANPDFSAIRMENSGQMAFYTHPYDTTDYSGNYITDANMLKYRRLTITPYGNVGIGITSPLTKLHIGGDNFMTIGDYSSSSGSKGIVFAGWRDVTPNFLGASIVADPSWLCCSGYPTGGYAGTKSVDLHFNVHDPNNWAANATVTAMSITSYGNVGIGTTNPQSLLAVNGTITAKQVTVTQVGWSDYVFEPSYKLRSLPSVENYIKANKHLPDLPSADEVAKKGIDLGTTQADLLRKIEELTLYAIEQHKAQQQAVAKNESLEKKLADQTTILQQQQSAIEQLKMLLTHKDTLLKLEVIEKQIGAHDEKIELIFEYLKELLTQPKVPRE